MKNRVSVTVTSVSFLILHLACLATLWVAFSWKAVALGVGLYLVRMFAITAGYHRYFSHRTFKLDRVSQFVIAFLAQTSAQKGVLWWAAHHRHHHKASDTPEDIHSPLSHGFWWSHVGWVLSDKYDRYDPASIQDFGKFPELRFLDTYHWICPWLLGTATFAFGRWTGIGGLSALVWGFFVSTVFLWHGTFSINSLSHLWGTRRFATTDDSRNNWLLAIIMLGEGWHNNHHYYQSSCRQGLRWWEVDFTFYALKILSWVGVVREMKTFPKSAFSQAKA